MALRLGKLNYALALALTFLAGLVCAPSALALGWSSMSVPVPMIPQGGLIGVSPTVSKPLAEQWDGVRWTATATAIVQGSPATLSGVACPTTQRCITVGWDVRSPDGGIVQAPLALLYDMPPLAQQPNPGTSGSTPPGSSLLGTKPPQITPTPTGPPSCTIAAASSRVVLPRPKGRAVEARPSLAPTLHFIVRCNQRARVSLAATVTARLKHARTRTSALRTTTASVAAGRRQTLSIKLSAGAITALRKGYAESVLATLTATSSAGKTRATARIGRLRIRRP